MVAYLANGFFYNQIYIHWFWTLILMMYVLSEVAGGFPTARDEKERSSHAGPLENRCVFRSVRALASHARERNPMNVLKIPPSAIRPAQ